MTKALLVAFCAAMSLPVWAQSLDRPMVKSGDTWTYRTTTEKGPTGWSQIQQAITVTHASDSTIYFTVQQSGSPQAPRELLMGSDWSRTRDVNGKQTVVNRPFSFPLSQGKSWKLDYTEQNPNPVHQAESWDNKYTVVGWEDVEVPAGKFHALKIEEDGTWTATMAPNRTVIQGAQVRQDGASLVTNVRNVTATEHSGRTYKAFWYVPAVKRWVKSVEEYYSSGGVRSERDTTELASFHVAP
ncbi:MAG TPA: hypothetical protein VHY19_12415 [Steroidobacteraceae bacterium]|nr:hypothetical protein [Steroidobacteraceae bacterium]